MFNHLKIFFAVIFVAVGAFAQDLITMRDGSEIQAVISEVGIDAIKYKKYHWQDGPYFSADISKVLSIRHRNGDKDFFELEEKTIAQTPQPFYIPFYIPQPDNMPTQEEKTLQTAQKTSGAQGAGGAMSLESVGGAGGQVSGQVQVSSGREVAVKQPTIDADYEKRQKNIVKFTADLPKIEAALKEIKASAPATYGVASLSVELLKTLNRMQEKKTFNSGELPPLVIQASLMSLPPQATTPLKTNTDLAVKTFSFLKENFKMPQNQAAEAINSALKSWNGKSVMSIKDEMKTVAPAHKLKVGMLLKYSVGIFANVIPQLNATVKASL
ncbi:MAG: hypothetical protein FWF51_10710 [Chitinivibrionia bacterium]|nr:hypothetical protein [Chitinivibrionia bacterium]